MRDSTRLAESADRSADPLSEGDADKKRVANDRFSIAQRQVALLRLNQAMFIHKKVPRCRNGDGGLNSALWWEAG